MTRAVLVVLLTLFTNVQMALALIENRTIAQAQTEGASEGSPIPPIENNPRIEPIEAIIEEYDYNPIGKRDPFRPFVATKREGGQGIPSGPLLPLQQFDIDQLKVVGIIWNVPKPKAMIMDPSNKGHIIQTNDLVGRNNGYVAAIRQGEIVIVEAFDNDGRISYITKVVKLHKEEKKQE